MAAQELTLTVIISSDETPAGRVHEVNRQYYQSARSGSRSHFAVDSKALTTGFIAFHPMKGYFRLMKDERARVDGRQERARSAMSLVFGEGVRPLQMRPAVFDAALEGWRRQMSARYLSEGTKRRGVRIVRRFVAETGSWPWEWTALLVDEWLEDLAAPPKRRSVSTLRNYQIVLRAFLDYLTDERYPWVAICEVEFDVRPMQVIDERNAIVHNVEYEGRPGAAVARGARDVL